MHGKEIKSRDIGEMSNNNNKKQKMRKSVCFLGGVQENISREQLEWFGKWEISTGYSREITRSTIILDQSMRRIHYMSVEDCERAVDLTCRLFDQCNW